MARHRAAGRRPKARIVDVAAKAGVSPTTVSYVLNDRPHVAIPEATRDRVWEAARALGYAPNPIARALRTGRTHMVGLTVSVLRQPFSVMLIQHLQQRVADDGWGALIMEGGMGATDVSARDHAVRLWPVDGIIAQASNDWVHAFLDAHRDRALPFVHLDVGQPVPGTDHVGYDLYAGAVDAVRHLIDQRCEDVLFLGPQASTGPGEARHDGYCAAIRGAGLTPRVHFCPRNDRQAGWQSFMALAETGCRPDGVLCYNDDLALGVCRALRDLGRRIPEDTAVVGVDDLPESVFAWPSLSTVRIPVDQIAEAAWTFLRNRLESPNDPPQAVFLRSELIVRESSTRRGRAR